jgi:drug/metabolite transporter (DMT)-like permease
MISAAVVGVCLFVIGNGLITFAEKSVPSIVTAVLVATTPIWFALLESLWPWGERLTIRGWLGLALGMAGVLVLLAPELRRIDRFFDDLGPLLILGSAFSWAIGSFVLRHRKKGQQSSHLLSAAYQMVIGGTTLTLVGLVAGESSELTAASLTPTAIFSFFYLLVVGSLVGFVAYNWLLGHVSPALVGTYAYVNPVVAILVGWLIGHETLSPWILGASVVADSLRILRHDRRDLPDRARFRDGIIPGDVVRGLAHCSVLDHFQRQAQLFRFRSQSGTAQNQDARVNGDGRLGLRNALLR